MGHRYFTSLSNDGEATVYRRDGRYGDTVVGSFKGEGADGKAYKLAWNKNHPKIKERRF